ncbi:MAG: serine/threonine protein kinase [Deltaproteobacteria bacterium]|nr:serine/threonine protein kinase [Deltaproteobacteria bacterium]
MPPSPQRAVPLPHGSSFGHPAAVGVLTDENDALGQVIDGRYRITGLIAKGGMARVFCAEQFAMCRRVAIKVMDASGARDVDREVHRRFQREVDACSRLSHPNIVRVYDHGTWGPDKLYLVMEYLPGRTLHDALRAGPMPGARLLSIVRQVAMALREAHAHGLVHRDIKPANVMLVDEGDGTDFVKVVDFGLVRNVDLDDGFTSVGSVAGSPSYMSPEQICGEAVDHRSDIYSLGVVLYRGVRGQPPFAGSDADAVLWGHINEPVPPLSPTLPALVDYPGLDAVIARCLNKSPADRFQSMDELLRALLELERVDQGAAPSPGEIETVELPIRAATPPLPVRRPARGETLSGWVLLLALTASLGAVASAMAVFGFLVGLGLCASADLAHRPLELLPLSNSVVW